MPKSTKNKPAKKTEKRAYTKRVKTGNSVNHFSDTDTFEIETAPPAPVRSDHQAVRDLTEKLRRTVGRLKPGQAFVVNGNSRATVRRILFKEFPEHLFYYGAIEGNKKATRVYLKK